MDFSRCSKVKQADMTSDSLQLLKKEYKAIFSSTGNSTGKELPKDSFNRKILIVAHEQARLSTEQYLRDLKDIMVVRSISADGPPALTSQIPELSNLKEIFFPQLELGKRHLGRVLFGTFCVKSFRMSSVFSVLGDKSGKAVRVVIYNVPISISNAEIDFRFSIGTKVAVKEPYFKLCADGKVAVRVENPDEVVVVDNFNMEVAESYPKLTELEKVVEEMDKLRGEGNLQFAKQKWSLAIEEYTKCIARSRSAGVTLQNSEKIKSSSLLAFSNRSEAWLQLLNFKNALDDANKALEIDATHSKSISRRDRAWQGFGKVMKAPPPSTEAKLPVVGSSASSGEVRLRGVRARREKEVAKVKHTEPKDTGVPPPSSAKLDTSSLGMCSQSPTQSKGDIIEFKSVSFAGDIPQTSLTDLKDSSSRDSTFEDVLQAVTYLPVKQFPESKIIPSPSNSGVSIFPELSASANDCESDSSPSIRSCKRKIAEMKSFSPPPVNSLEISAFVSKKLENPSIDVEDPLFASWLDSCRSSGDSLLAQGKWGDAICVYDRVIGFIPPEKNRDKVIQALFLAYSHRSEAWIWLGNYENSLRDANYALELFVTYPKSVVGFDAKNLLNEVRRGRAYHGLGEYEVACSIFSSALAKSSNDKSIKYLLEKSRICNEQSRDGIYDLNDYFINGCQGPPPPCGDFVGPVVIKLVNGKGRGLFSTRDVESGELILVSSPLAVVRRRFQRHGQEDKIDYSRLSSAWRRNDASVGLEDFVERLSLLQSERKMYQLYSLAIGDRQELIEIPDINVFIPGSRFELPLGWENLTTDLERLRCIVRMNAIDGGLNPLESAAQNQNNAEAIGCVGLWVLPSFMNHSCAPNCHILDVGNAMFVRASRNILAGEELSRAYFDVYQNGIDRQYQCDEWLFVCNCERCVLEKDLTFQRVLPLHDYRNLLGRVREESVKRLQKVEKGGSLSLLLPNPQPAHLQLRKFAKWFDGFLATADSLTNRERAWIGASHLEVYISKFHASKDSNELILALEIILDFMTNSAILSAGQTENAIQKAALLLGQVEANFGICSQTYRRVETRVLDLYRTTYGSLRKDVLLNIGKFLIGQR